MTIMIMMMCLIVILPLMARLLTFGKKNKTAMSYMGGVNSGDDRSFIDSMGQPKKMYLANWYMSDMFGEDKILKISLILSTAALVILMIVAIGGAI